jgi:hypothetical protein
MVFDQFDFGKRDDRAARLFQMNGDIEPVEILRGIELRLEAGRLDLKATGSTSTCTVSVSERMFGALPVGQN